MLSCAPMDGYCLAQLFEEEDAIAVEPSPAWAQLRFDETYCWVCGAAIVDVHCRIVCQRCGFTRDCGDP